MSLIDRARRFTEPNPVESQITIIEDCLKVKNTEAILALKLLFMDMYGGATYNMDEKLPPALALGCCGNDGFRSIYEAVLELPTFKNKLISLQVLAAVATGVFIDYLKERVCDQYANIILKYIDENACSDVARYWLQECLFNLTNDYGDLNLVFSNFFGFNAFSKVDICSILFSVAAMQHITISDKVLQSYENLLKNKENNEPELHSFFEQYPQLIDPMVHRLWSKPNIFGRYEPDFIVQRKDNSYLVVEIECPQKKILTGNQLTSQANHAVMQVIDYEDYIRANSVLLEKSFPNIGNIDCLVVIGKESELTNEQIKSLSKINANYKNINLVGFDWLLERATGIRHNIFNDASIEKRLLIR